MKNTSKLYFGNKIFNEKQRALELIEMSKKKVNNLVSKRKPLKNSGVKRTTHRAGLVQSELPLQYFSL